MQFPLLTGEERFSFNSATLPFDVKEFWSWNGSNLLNNTLRGALAEYIVAKALDLEISYARDCWSEYDLLYGSVRIEVKSSAYLQAWNQTHLSEIRFSVAPAFSSFPDQSQETEKIRHSDVYVFCLYGCRDRAQVDLLNLDHWQFYIIPTSEIDRLDGTDGVTGKLQSISLKSLLRICPAPADYGQIKARIDSII